MAALGWQAWAPPLDPPAAGGLPADAALAIADACWDTDPHLCAALQWESYAAMQVCAPGACCCLILRIARDPKWIIATVVSAADVRPR
jgi:hypothetical protein